MIVSFRQILADQPAGSAVGAFTCYETTTAIGVVQAAAAESAPVILLISKAAFSRPGGDLLLSALVAVADRADVACCVQLDHVDDLQLIKRALDLGAGAVMADGSRLPFAENVGLVREAVRLARVAGAGVEAELGHIEGGEDIAALTRAGALTDPEEARRYLEDSGADCLAVSIGNVHGAYAAPPALDWPRLAGIRSRVTAPLSLHGASGLPASDVRKAVASGVRKVNVNAELRRRAFDELSTRLPGASAGHNMLELQEALAGAARDVARELIALLQQPSEAMV